MPYWWHNPATSGAVSAGNAVATPSTVVAVAATPSAIERASAIAPLQGAAAPLISNLTQTELTLIWDPVVGATKYDIERNGVIIVSNWLFTSLFEEGLTPNTSYRYRVLAKP